METRKKVNQKPKNTKRITVIVTSIVKTLWAIGTSVVAAGVLLSDSTRPVGIEDQRS